jgi:hypothetical protein
MKNKINFFKIIALIAATGFLAACGDNPSESDNTGATVTTPTLASKTTDSITINAVSAPGNGQTVEYGINTAIAAPSKWQDGLTFDGLEWETTYYVFARSKENSTHSTGEASAGLRVITNSANINLTVSNTAEWNAALDTIKNGGNGTAERLKPYTVTVSGDVMVNGSTDNSFGAVSNVSVTLKGNGKLYIIGQGSLLNIGSNQTVCIDSADLTLQGLKSGQNDSAFNNNRAVVYSYFGTLELRNGTISGNTTSGDGGSGVYASGGTFTMSGGTISGNSGGGVYVSGSGGFTMSGGTIRGNTSSAGGGVYATSFTMSGGTISGNTSGSGGGVYATNFTMSGGTISGNTTTGIDSYGGGVYAGTFNMTGGTIRGNTATNIGDPGILYAAIFGGGVYISDNGSMSGGTISGNTVSGRGYFDTDEFIYRYGGGVYVGGSFTKSGGGIIYGNDAANDAYKNTASSGGSAVSGGPGRFNRNTTLGETDNISTNTQTGWGQ